MPRSLKQMVRKQVTRVLERGSRLERFDQLRSRHFWSTHLFVPDGNAQIRAGVYDIFKAIPSQTGQGYPTNTPLTLRETNWLNSGRVPDNQNFVITEVGVTLLRPPAVDPQNTPGDSIYDNLTPAQQAFVSPLFQMNNTDASNILYGFVLEMQFLTNAVPLGLLADFSQSAGAINDEPEIAGTEAAPTDGVGGDPVNGVPAAAFRRKLEVPILLQHGETMGMRLNLHRTIELQGPQVGTGYFEIRVDWWAHESFAEKS